MEIIVLQDKHMAGDKPEVILANGTWIAGGSVRRWFTGEKQDSDIDVFCKDKDSGEAIISLNNLTEKRRTDKMVLFKNSPIQLILDPNFDTPELSIEHFDYSICQFAYDGQQIIATLEAILSSTRKHLSVNKIQAGYEIDSLRRAFKYAKQGYWPCIGTIRDLAKAINLTEPENLTKFDEISPDRWD